MKGKYVMCIAPSQRCFYITIYVFSLLGDPVLQMSAINAEMIKAALDSGNIADFCLTFAAEIKKKTQLKRQSEWEGQIN